MSDPTGVTDFIFRRISALESKVTELEMVIREQEAEKKETESASPLWSIWKWATSAPSPQVDVVEERQQAIKPPAHLVGSNNPPAYST